MWDTDGGQGSVVTGGNVALLRARALALMFSAGPVLALVALALPGADEVAAVPWALNASLAFPVAAVLWLWGHRFPEVVLHLALVGGALIVALGIVFGRGSSLSVAAGFFFIWVALYAFSFLPWRLAAGHVVLDTGLLVSALLLADVDAAAGVALVIVGTSAVVGAVTGMTRAELAHLATVDHLTGLPNRRRLHEDLRIETARADRTGIPYSVALLDLDGFKAVNDQHGHHAGDELLIAAANAWRSCLRPTDLLARYGGDEFVAVLPLCGPASARRIADRLCEVVRAPCSLGLATWRPGEQPEDVLRRADAALYHSKRQGGQRLSEGDR